MHPRAQSSSLQPCLLIRPAMGWSFSLFSLYFLPGLYRQPKIGHGCDGAVRAPNKCVVRKTDSTVTRKSRKTTSENTRFSAAFLILLFLATVTLAFGTACSPPLIFTRGPVAGGDFPVGRDSLSGSSSLSRSLCCFSFVRELSIIRQSASVRTKHAYASPTHREESIDGNLLAIALFGQGNHSLGKRSPRGPSFSPTLRYPRCTSPERLHAQLGILWRPHRDRSGSFPVSLLMSFLSTSAKRPAFYHPNRTTWDDYTNFWPQSAINADRGHASCPLPRDKTEALNLAGES